MEAGIHHLVSKDNRIFQTNATVTLLIKLEIAFFFIGLVNASKGKPSGTIRQQCTTNVVSTNE